MPQRAARPTGKKLLRAATDELGLTTPKTARRRPGTRLAKKPPARVKKF